MRLAGVTGDKDPVVEVWAGPVADLHPHRTGAHLAAALHSPLVASNPVSRLPGWGDDAPGALLAAIRSTDLVRWELELKPGRTWHDGTPVTAADVERGITAAVEAGAPIASTIAGVRAVDADTVALALDAPFGPLPHLLGVQALLPLHPTDPEGVGTGPYTLAATDEDVLELAVVPGHPAAEAGAEAVLRVGRGLAPTAAADVTVGTDGDVAPRGGPGAPDRRRVLRLPGRQLTYLGLPQTIPGLADDAAARALSLSLDREALVEAVVDGAGVPADRLLAPGMARPPGVGCTACRHDPAAAAALWPGLDGPLTIWTAEDARSRDLADALAAAWTEVLDVEDVQLASAPSDRLVELVTGGEVDGPFRLGWQPDAAAPVRLLEPLFGPRGGANDVRFRSDVVADALAEAGTTRDLDASLEAYGRVEALILDAMPVIPLWWSTIPVATRTTVTGVVLDGEGRLVWTQLRG